MVPKGLSKGRFEQLYKSGIVAASKNFRFLAGPGQGRVGIATAKALGTKPNRNRAKRRMREIVRATADGWRPELDYIVLMKLESGRTAYEALRRDAQVLLAGLNERWDAESGSS